jgi:hypothetical protein
MSLLPISETRPLPHAERHRLARVRRRARSARHFFFAGFDLPLSTREPESVRPGFDFAALLFVFFVFLAAVFTGALAGASAGVGGAGGRA